MMDENILMQVINSSSASIFMLDSDFNLIFSNDSSKKILLDYDLEYDFFKKQTNPFSFPVDFISKNIEVFSNGEKIPLKELKILDYIIEIDGHVSALMFENEIKGLSLSINKIKKIISSSQPKRRTFKIIRNLILEALFIQRKTINQVAKDINVNWRTVESHLTHLVGKKFVKEVFSSEYVRIFDITEEGRIKLGIEKHKARTESFLNLSSNNIRKSLDLDNNMDNLKTKDYEMSQEVQR